MGKLLLLGLAIAWVVVLGPTLFRRNDERGPSSLDAARERLATIHQSRRVGGRHLSAEDQRARVSVEAVGGDSLGSLRVTNGLSPDRTLASTSHRKRRQRRRAQVLQILLGCCALSLLLAVGTSDGTVWLLNLGCDAVLLGYILSLRSVKNRSARRRPHQIGAADPRSVWPSGVLFYDDRGSGGVRDGRGNFEPEDGGDDGFQGGYPGWDRGRYALVTRRAVNG